jgi:hypothetical protein
MLSRSVVGLIRRNTTLIHYMPLLPTLIPTNHVPIVILIGMMQNLVTNYIWKYGINNQNLILHHIDIMGVVWHKDLILTIFLKVVPNVIVARSRYINLAFCYHQVVDLPKCSTIDKVRVIFSAVVVHNKHGVFQLKGY